jgi:hypothetical protein
MHAWQSDALTTRLDLIRSRLALIRTRLDLIRIKMTHLHLIFPPKKHILFPKNRTMDSSPALSNSWRPRMKRLSSSCILSCCRSASDPYRFSAANTMTASRSCKKRNSQCCHLLAKLSGQSGGKIRPLRKKSGPRLNLTFSRDLG